jgi:nitrate reductase NapE component
VTPFLSYALVFIAGALCGGLGFIAYMFVMILQMEPRRIDGQ